MEIKKKTSKEKKLVKGQFSQEFYMNRNELAVFLRNLADQVEGEDELQITSEEWILPFKPVGHAQVDIDLEEDELEIEIEFKKSTGTLYAGDPAEESKKDEGDLEEEEYEPDYAQ
jgi:amphi-Trp domain-containing protein